MDEGWLNSGSKLAERLYQAANDMYDWRCMMFSGFELESSDVVFQNGNYYCEGYVSDAPMLTLVYCTLDELTEQVDRSKFRIVGEAKQPNFAAKRTAIKSRLLPLLRQAGYWLSQRPPNTYAILREFSDGIERWSETEWIKAVFRLAWQRHSDTILVAQQFYPQSLLVKLSMQDWELALSQSDQRATQEMYEAKLRTVLNEHSCAARKYQANEKEFCSILPVDPLTASALAIEWLVGRAKQSIAGDTTVGVARVESEKTLSVGRLIELMEQSESCDDLAKKQMAKVTGPPETGSKSAYYIGTAQTHGSDRNRAQSKYVGQPGVAQLKLLCEADGSAEWRSKWVVQQRATYCLSAEVEKETVDAMAVVEFAQGLSGSHDDTGGIDESDPKGIDSNRGEQLISDDHLRDYVPASEIRTKHVPAGLVLDQKRLVAFLRSTSDIRTGRPPGKDGKPRQNRLVVHLGDWVRNRDNLRAFVGPKADRLESISDDEITQRTAAVRKSKQLKEK